MLDVIGGMVLNSIAVLLVGALVVGATREGERRAAFALLATIWYAGIATLTALGAFSGSSGFGAAAIGAAVLVPVVAGVVAFTAALGARALAFGVPLTTLVGAHVGRLFGVFFLALHEGGRLPPTFALTAGWGDVFVGLTAVPLAWAIQRRMRGWRAITAAWNALATLDLITAVTLGVGSAPNSPVRFIFENPNTVALTTLPWSMIPGFMVPLYILMHLAIFAQLAVSATSDARLPLWLAARGSGPSA